MGRRWRGILVAGSFVLLAITVAGMVRSFRVVDSIHWHRTTAEPLTRAAERYAERHNFKAEFVANQSTWWVQSARGRLVLMNYESREPLPGTARDDERLFNRWFWAREQAELGPPDDWQYRGWLARVGFASEEQSSSTRLYAVYRAVTVPMWPIALMAALPLMVWLKRVLRQWYRRRRGRCAACGYDLRAQPEGRRCPECGALPQSAAMPDYTRPPATAVPR